MSSARRDECAWLPAGLFTSRGSRHGSGPAILLLQSRAQARMWANRQRPAAGDDCHLHGHNSASRKLRRRRPCWSKRAGCMACGERRSVLGAQWISIVATPASCCRAPSLAAPPSPAAASKPGHRAHRPSHGAHPRVRCRQHSRPFRCLSEAPPMGDIPTIVRCEKH